jgi:predicted nucleotide-binding protein (sugar kinase/HSP70/actin superfamily)
MLRERIGSSRRVSETHPLAGKKTWVPRMSTGSARAVAAVLRSIGIDAEATPPSTTHTLELGGRFTSGDECYPLRVTLGDFLSVLEQPGTDPNKTAFFMATGQGPCRFGQYAPYTKSVLATLGYPGVTIVSPACETGYSDFGEVSDLFVRGVWRALVAGDILLKMLLKLRPYEESRGSADAAHEECVNNLCATLQTPYGDNDEQMEALKQSLRRSQRRLREVPMHFDARRPLIGIVGEIFCRLNTFSNNELVRRLEEFGAEVWVNDIAEWIWYVNVDQFRKLRLQGKSFSLEAFGAHIRNHIQRKDEHELTSLFREDFQGYEEPKDVREVLAFAEPYLPAAGANGEMVVNVGKSIYFARKGVDGVIDISPFSCMNGIICEAIYPRVSRDNAGMPIRNFYFDGTQSDLDRDIGIFLELARSYQCHKPWPRRMPILAAGASA